MPKLTAYNLVHAIDTLPKNRIYDYIGRTTTKFVIDSIQKPGGPIVLRRWNPAKGETKNDAKRVSISENMIWRYANAFSDGVPVNCDRVFGASYNTRSLLEALVAYTPEFYYCRPGRYMSVNGAVSVESGHKHLIWLPNLPHPAGLHQTAETNMVVSELPTQAAVYDDSLLLPSGLALADDMSSDELRRHTQIQVALYIIGLSLGYKTYIAQNDQGYIYKGKRLAEHEGMFHSLAQSIILANMGNAVNAGKLIDVVWFVNDADCPQMPAVMEVEHTTGVTSGLTRMKNFYDKASFIKTRYVIVADDELREKVYAECVKPQFKELQPWYFPYSEVDYLYSLCSKKGLMKGVSDSFLDNFMEPIFGDKLSAN